MQLFTKKLFGSELKIAFFDEKIDKKDIEFCFEMTQNFENKYSRFISGNLLDKLNKEKTLKNPEQELLSLLNLCQKVSELSEGYFDITLLPILENMGYGKEKNRMKENVGYKNIDISEEKIELKNGVNIELGSVGKGFAVDKIYDFLDEKYNHFIINFGGDIRVKGQENILLEDPNNDTKQIGNITLVNSSLSSSGKNKRKTSLGHHIINPKKSQSAEGKQSVFVEHPLATFSDIFATTLFASPLEIAIKIINTVPNLEALIILENGEIYKSTNFKTELNV